MKIARAVLSLLALASPLLADTYTSMSPTSGPTSGGTVVTIKGDFAPWNHGVLFGSVPATTTTLVDEHTLVAVTPPHLPGLSKVSVFEYDIVVGTTFVFAFEGGVPPEMERVLLPIFTPPVKGAFGSEFHTDFRARITEETKPAQIFGIESEGPYWDGPSGDPYNRAIDLHLYRPELKPGETILSGNPGRFLYLPPGPSKKLAMNLRVYDVTRDAQNFGTEIPVVHEDDFFDGEPIVLLGVPTDPRFRDTLRIYGTAPATVRVTVSDSSSSSEQIVTLNQSDSLQPSYATFGDFVSNRGAVSVKIERISGDASLWALVTVTNNDTQMITTITPQR